MAWRVADRAGKVFIDHNMNRQGANIAAAYSLRPGAARAGLDAAHVGRGRRAAGSSRRTSGSTTCGSGSTRVGDLWAGVREGPCNDLSDGDGGARRRARGATRAARSPAPRPRASRPRPRTRSRSRRRTRRCSSTSAAASSVPRGRREPAPGDEAGEGNSFVIHKHRATRLHYDVRLERDGALPSWAVPEGAADQRRATSGMAVRTEDPPARVRVVRGHDPRGPLRRGRGPDLRRRLVRADRVDRHEGLVPAARPALPRAGVPLREDEPRLARVPRERADRAADPLAPAVPADARRGRAGALRRRRRGGSSPSSTASDAWPRCRRARRSSARGPGATRPRTYPELHMIHELVDQVNAVIDGEIVAFDADGRNSFETLQQRMNLANPREIDRVRARIPVTLVAFDLLWLDGRDVTGLRARGAARAAARSSWRRTTGCGMTAHVEGEGTALVEAAPRPSSSRASWRSGSARRTLPGRRTDAWRKIKLRQTAGLRDPRVHAGPGWPERDLRRAARRRLRRRRAALGRPGRAAASPRP